MANISQNAAISQIIGVLDKLATDVKTNKGNIDNPFKGTVTTTSKTDLAVMKTAIAAKVANPTNGNMVELKFDNNGSLEYSLAIYDATLGDWEIDLDFKVTGGVVSAGISQSDADKRYNYKIQMVEIGDKTTNADLAAKLTAGVTDGIDAYNVEIRYTVGNVLYSGTLAYAPNTASLSGTVRKVLQTAASTTGSGVYALNIVLGSSVTAKPTINMVEIAPLVDDTTLTALATKVNGI